MVSKVRLEELVEALDIQNEECVSYLNTVTGRTTSVMQEYADLAAEDAEADARPAWMQECADEAREVLNSVGTKYLPLPTPHEVHEYAIMERFIITLSDPEAAEDLAGTIRGKGAFGRFKDGVAHWNVQDKWHDFRHKALTEVAVRWCEGSGIAYEGGTGLGKKPASLSAGE